MTKKSGTGKRSDEVEMNVTAMLDMAFQLLAFFIMTFQQPPSEGQICMNLPPPQAVISSGNVTICDGLETVTPIDTLAITLQADQSGITSVNVGLPNAPMTSIAFGSLEDKVADCFVQGAGAFKQVIIQASPQVRWDYVMKTMDICSRQKKADGSKLEKLSFVCLAKENSQ
jgi:biopolymer transport protein ExbD